MIIGALSAFVFSSLSAPYTASAEDSLCTIPNPTDSKICYDDFYSGNNILYYDPNAKDCAAPVAGTPSGPLVGNDNTEKVFHYFTGKGLSAEQAAGIISNFKKEAYDRIDPGASEDGTIKQAGYIPVHGTGFGIAQWTWDDRQKPLVALSQSSGRSIVDLSLQLDYVWQELNQKFPNALASLKAATTPEDAAFVFHRDYEGSNDSKETIVTARGGGARKAYDKLKSLALATPNTAVSSNCSSQPGTGPNTDSTKFLSDSFVIYNQCQFPPYGGSWGTRLTPSGGTMCQNACIPTSLAMIARNITGAAITPENTIDYYDKNNLWNPGFGSYNSSPLTAAGAFGLKVETIANKSVIESYKAVFDNGGQIMAISTGTAPFMPTRHAVVIRGITAEGNFMVADPGRSETNTSPVNQPTVNKILTDIRSDSASVVYAFYKQ
jgi:hypothetical protein